jgi:multimeric flavodoxin WrbA
MTNVVVLYGSPHKNGNTSTLGKKVLQGLTDNGIDSAREFWLNDLTIKPCQACFRCRTNHCCVTQDDMQTIYPALKEANLVIFAIPIFWWNMSAQMKLCIDRFTALLEGKDQLPALAGKEIIVVISYNYQDCARATIGMFEDFKDWIGVNLQLVEYCAKSGPLREDKQKLDEAYQLGCSTALRICQAN